MRRRRVLPLTVTVSSPAHTYFVSRTNEIVVALGACGPLEVPAPRPFFALFMRGSAVPAVALLLAYGWGAIGAASVTPTAGFADGSVATHEPALKEVLTRDG